MKRRIANTFIITFTLAVAAIFIFKYGTAKNTFYGDAFGYYLYLPSTFIHHNIKTPFDTQGNNISDGIKWCFGVIKGAHNAKGFYLNQYTYGIALMESPFFFIAHGYEKVKGLDANGYSETYNLLIKAGTLIYALLGLLITYKILRRYFSSSLSLLGISGLFLCTNLFWFAIFQSGMAHVPLFFLYALLIWLTIKLHEAPNNRYFIITGLVAGIITLIRPTDIICLLIPLLYEVNNRAAFKNKIAFLKQHKKAIGWMIVAFIIPIIPQLLYWKAITGGFVTYSYGDQSFNFREPKIIEGLFYFSNGWFPYSPIMLFSILGLLFYKQLVKWEWCIIILFSLYVYIIYSWYCYYYINGLGSRPMIHLYPLLAIPLVAFFKYISERNFIIKASFVTVCLFFVAMNLCYSIQQVLGVIDSPDSNMAFNLQMLFRTQLTYDDLIVKNIGERQPDTNKITKLRSIANENFDDSISTDYIKDTLKNSGYLFHWHDEDYMEVAVIPYNKQMFNDARWFKCSGRFMSPNNLDYFRHILNLDINNKEKLWRGFKVENNLHDSTVPLTLNRCVTKKWDQVSFFAKVPGNLKDGDIIRVMMWVSDKTELYMDDITLELYK